MKQFLNKDERNQLATQHRKVTDGRTRDRIKAVLMSDTGWTFKNIAEALLLDQETVSRHVKEYKERQSSREPLYRDSLSHHRTSDVAYGGFAVMFTKS